MRTRRSALALALAGLVAALVACTGSRTPDPSSGGGRVRLVLSADPASLSLVGKTDYNSDIVARLVGEGLVQYDTSLELRPRIAESWEVSDDGLVVTFRLRDGVRWHDGVPVTARDVAFTVDKVLDPATEARAYVSQFEDIRSVDVVDDLTLRVTYDRPYADFLDAWQIPLLPEHVAGKDADFLTGRFASHPVGSGPFRFVRWTPGQEIVLDANPDYWEGRPGVDGIVFRIVPNDRTAYEALLRGDIDLLVVPPDLWRESKESPRAAGLVRFVYYRLNVWYVGWNSSPDHPWFADPRVRRAMMLALDRQRFVDRVLDGLARPAVTTFHPDSPWADPDLAPIPFDPAEASRLLDEAGWVDTDGDGVRDRDGREFSFTLLAPVQLYEVADRLAAWMQQSLASVGVGMEIRKLEWRAFQERRRAGQFDAAMASFILSPTPDQYEVYHSSAVASGLNYVRFADAEVDRLLERGRRSFDPAERHRIYRALQARILELQPVGCLFYFANPVLHRDRLEGFTPSPLGLYHVTPGPRRWRLVEPAAGG